MNIVILRMLAVCGLADCQQSSMQASQRSFRPATALVESLGWKRSEKNRQRSLYFINTFQCLEKTSSDTRPFQTGLNERPLLRKKSVIGGKMKLPCRKIVQKNRQTSWRF
ncbi:hypothetical protein [Aquicoccus sp. SU-CL01552]|uniref:hypothetical protein n=1 Tax=Aquicoccus sp. SU-CL01552 TaxID=3127656 RepID=UPI00333F862A